MISVSYVCRPLCSAVGEFVAGDVLIGNIQSSVARHAAPGPRYIRTAPLSHTPQTDVWVPARCLLSDHSLSVYIVKDRARYCL